MRLRDLPPDGVGCFVGFGGARPTLSDATARPWNSVWTRCLNNVAIGPAAKKTPDFRAQQGGYDRAEAGNCRRGDQDLARVDFPPPPERTLCWIYASVSGFITFRKCS
jgi:hypothetical protein